MSTTPTIAGQTKLHAAAAARRLQVGVTTFYEWIRLDGFPTPEVLPSGRRRWLASELDAWMESLRKTRIAPKGRGEQ